MAAPFFPNEEQILTLLMAELPEGVYAEDRADDPNPDNRSYSSSELRAHSRIYAQMYSNLEEIAENKNVSTLTATYIDKWEKDLFTTAQDASQSFAIRKQKVIAKFRKIGGISLPAIYDDVAAILDPLGLPFDILPYSGQNNGDINGAWIFEESHLDLDTFLSALDPIIGEQIGSGLTPLDCDLDYAAAGLTAQDLIDIQTTAYKYEVRIFGNADAMTLAILDAELTSSEPARSDHFIRNNATGAVPP